MIINGYLLVRESDGCIVGHHGTLRYAKGRRTVENKQGKHMIIEVTGYEVCDGSDDRVVCEPVKKVIRDMSHLYCIEDCQKWMEISLVDDVRCETEHGRCGDDEISEVFLFKGKYYKIIIEIEWNRYDKQYYYIDGSRILSCEEVECPE